MTFFISPKTTISSSEGLCHRPFPVNSYIWRTNTLPWVGVQCALDRTQLQHTADDKYQNIRWHVTLFVFYCQTCRHSGIRLLRCQSEEKKPQKLLKKKNWPIYLKISMMSDLRSTIMVYFFIFSLPANFFFKGTFTTACDWLLSPQKQTLVLRLSYFLFFFFFVTTTYREANHAFYDLSCALLQHILKCIGQLGEEKRRIFIFQKFL